MMALQRDLFTGEVIPDKRNGREGRLRRANGHARSNGHRVAPVPDATTKELVERVAALEKTIGELRDCILQGQTSKESYSTQEVASILGRKPYTVREWCRLRRINATKAMCGRGCEEEWRVSHDELVRIQNEGLLPPPERF